MCILSLQIYLFWIFHVNRIIWKVVFVTSFFHFAYSQRSSRLWHVLRLHSFLWPNTPLYGYATFYLSILWLIDFCVVSTLGILRRMLLWTFLKRFLYGFFFKYIAGKDLVGHMVNLYLTFWGTAKLLQSGHIILHSHQQYQDSNFSTVSLGFVIVFLTFAIFVGVNTNEFFWRANHPSKVEQGLERNSDGRREISTLALVLILGLGWVNGRRSAPIWRPMPWYCRGVGGRASISVFSFKHFL